MPCRSRIHQQMGGGFSRSSARTRSGPTAAMPTGRATRTSILSSSATASLPHAAGLRPARYGTDAVLRRAPAAGIEESVATDGAKRPFFTHHFVGGNTLVTRIIGKDLDASGNVAAVSGAFGFQLLLGRSRQPLFAGALDAYRAPRLFHSAGPFGVGPPAPRAERLSRRPQQAQAGGEAPLHISIANTGAVITSRWAFRRPKRVVGGSCHDLETGRELPIRDASGIACRSASVT